MKTDEFWKKCLAEAELNEKEVPAAARIVSHLRNTPESLRPHNPPAGYEDHLLAALRRKLPEEKKRVVREKRSLWSFEFSQSWGWGLGFSVAGLLAFVLYTGSNVDTPVAQDKNYLELVGGDEESARNWLATVSDAGFRLENSDEDLQGIAIQVSKDEKLLKKMISAIGQWEH